VLVAGGLAGTVSDIGENFVTVEIADGVRVRVQKAAIGNVLPKGTLKAA
jgi:preprotein translocase subunit YajC